MYDDRKKEDFRLALCDSVNVIKSISGIMTEHTKPEIIIPEKHDDLCTVLIETRFRGTTAGKLIHEAEKGHTHFFAERFAGSLSKDDCAEGVYRSSYRVMCPSGFHGDDRKYFIDEIEKKLSEE